MPRCAIRTRSPSRASCLEDQVPPAACATSAPRLDLACAEAERQQSLHQLMRFCRRLRTAARPAPSLAGWHSMSSCAMTTAQCAASFPATSSITARANMSSIMAGPRLCGALAGHYYPKLQVSVPFTPVTGPRLLTPDAGIKPLLLEALIGLCRTARASSVHITFLPERDAEIADEDLWLRRQDIQFHWSNQGYDRASRSFWRRSPPPSARTSARNVAPCMKPASPSCN